MGKTLTRKEMNEKRNQTSGKTLKKSKGALSKKRNKMKMPLLNPMVFFPRFPHITDQIIDKLEKNSLKNCREVSKPWQNYVDHRNLLWNKIVEEKGGQTAFRLACENGHIKMAEMLLQNPAKFIIDLNAKTNKKKCSKMTGFHFACKNGHSEIAELLIQKSDDFNIDLNAQAEFEQFTALHLAIKNGQSTIGKSNF